MAYKDILSDVIKNSGLSLREIATRCEIKGVSITPSYISQLQSGKLNPPSEDVSRAIAEVCKVDATNLILEGYLEKAPDIIKYYFTVSSASINEFIKIIYQLLSPEQFEQFKNNFNKFINANNDITNLHYFSSYIEKLKNRNRIKSSVNTNKLLNNNFTDIYRFNELENIFIEDDSMEPLIPKGSLIKYDHLESNKIKNYDTIVFNFISEEKILIRRFYRLDDKKIILVPENKKFDILEINNIEEIIIYGKVATYTANIGNN